MKYFIICFLSFILSGCAMTSKQAGAPVYTHQASMEITQRVIPIYMDKMFGERMRVAGTKIIGEYNKAFNGLIRFELASDQFNMEDGEIREAMDRKGFLILKINSDSKFLDDRAGEKTLERCNAVGGWKMFIAEDRLSDGDEEYVLRHALAHLLGAEHTNSGLMGKWFNRNGYACIDLDAARMMASFQGLDWRKMNYCHYE